jgi:Uri superfamily endonuclease
MKGIYCLLIKVKSPVKIKVGGLGKINFKKGYYAYVGSALGNLQARVARHLREKKKLRWHIDYFLASPKVEIEQILVKPTRKKLECSINKRIQKFGIGIKGFGCSDCDCRSHLTYFKSYDEGKRILKDVFNR